MKKLLVSLGIAAAVASGAAPAAPRVQAAAPVQNASGGQWIVVNDGDEAKDTLKKILEECGIRLNQLCFGWLPGWPDIDETQPETSAPEAEEPETSAPEIEEPETSAPAPSEPETSIPETSAPSEEVHPYILRIVEPVNEERAKAGLNALKLDTAAARAASVRAKEIVSSFSHTRPDGRSFTTALAEQGVNYRMAGENIAWGQRSPEQVMEGRMNSPGHRANILRESFTHIGVGYHQEGGVNYWTQLFASMK